jgi:hypothetical protein
MMRRYFVLAAVALVFSAMNFEAFGETYKIDLREPGKEIYRGHLKLGGSNPQGESVSFTNYYMEMNGEPVLPVMGEFHYSRYAERDWEQEILKMKAGGMDIIPTYVFWSLHEEEEGVFDWSGDRNLRRFVELCAKNNVWTIVRVGPFCHGEIRSGGIPDWLYGRPFEVRSNDEGYLYYVKRLYNEIGRQLEGLFFKDGGPIIGVQLENEFQHSASPWALAYPGQPLEWTAAQFDKAKVLEGVGSKEGETSKADPYGELHMKTLKKLAIEAGLIAPLYTGRGWGGGGIIENETIPVTSAYPYPNWADIEPSPLYLFKDLQKDPDYPPAKYHTERYPSFSSEMGAGMMVRYTRRPYVPTLSVEAMVVRALGCGANAIGYYMYHGGSTPQGKHSFMSDEAYGYPKISYDFQAPLGEFGQVRESYHSLKLLHLFVNEFGSELAPMVTVLPEGADSIKPADIDALRYSARVKGESGFLFLNNFQDHVENHDIEGIKFELELPGGNLSMPRKGFVLKKDAATILPFNMSLGGVLLKYATAQLLTKVESCEGSHYFFFSPEGLRPEYAFDSGTVSDIKVSGDKVEKAGEITYVKPKAGKDSVITVTGTDGSVVKVTTLTREQALDSYKVKLWGKERLVVSNAMVLGRCEFLQLQQVGCPEISFSIYPDVKGGFASSAGDVGKSSDGIFSRYEIKLAKKDVGMEVKRVGENKMVLSFPADAMDSLNEVFLKIDYVGDTGMAFVDGRLATDSFYYSRPWWIGLKKYVPKVLEKGMYFYFKPLLPDANYIQDLPAGKVPDFSDGPVLEIKSVEAIPEYEVILSKGGC